MPRTQTGSLALIIVTAGSVLLAARPAQAQCDCSGPPEIAQSYDDNSDVVRANITRKKRVGSTLRYTATVVTTFKGCLEAGQAIVLSTPASDCRVRLSVGTNYLINGDEIPPVGNKPTLPIDACDYNVAFASLSAFQVDWLNRRFNCCGDDCACADGSPVVECFADPCSVTEACAEADVCESNYCSGCFADFYESDGSLTCEPEETLPSEGEVCDGECAEGLACCYPCGTDGCSNICTTPCPGGPGCIGGCFLFP